MIRLFEIMASQQVNPHLLCSICREVFYNPIRATCGHTFCGTCLVRWIQQKKSCPLCRHQLERNYKFDKDILASKIVGDIQVKCLKCQQWNGSMALFKQHKTKCKFIQRNNEIPLNAIEIGDDDNDVTFSFIIDTHKTIIPANSSTLVQIDEQSVEQEIDPQINLRRQNNDIPNNNFQVETNQQFINDQTNHIIQVNVLQEESSQQQQIVNEECDNNQQKSDNLNNSNQSDESNKLNNSDLSNISNISNKSYKSNRVRKQKKKSDRQKIQKIQNKQNNSDKLKQLNVIYQGQEMERNDEQIQISEQENNKVIQKGMLEQNESEIEILQPSIRILNNHEMKEQKSIRKFRINIIKNSVSVSEPLMNEDLLNELSKLTNEKLDGINKINTVIG
ncbi:unnamed protein product [Paramecium sonneborni]|uniref:RING-type domain-containing protein n=1 Tax=Paramecium sonneborni TaxID=65129 RepID=A0A8S1RLS2_9CILI|nr:unnamed protein product [Paramecium sonneborni]